MQDLVRGEKLVEVRLSEKGRQNFILREKEEVAARNRELEEERKILNVLNNTFPNFVDIFRRSKLKLSRQTGVGPTGNHSRLVRG